MGTIEDVKGEFRNRLSAEGNKSECSNVETQFYIEKTKSFNISLEALLVTIERINNRLQQSK